MTNALRAELAPRNIRVSGLHFRYTDTDLTAGVDAPKLNPAAIAALALDQLAPRSPPQWREPRRGIMFAATG